MSSDASRQVYNFITKPSRIKYMLQRIKGKNEDDIVIQQDKETRPKYRENRTKLKINIKILIHHRKVKIGNQGLE